MSNCPAALNIEGEHFACDLSAPHPGLAHSSRADERQKVAALLADEGTVEKVARALLPFLPWWSLDDLAPDAARAALDVIAGLIGGEDE